MKFRALAAVLLTAVIAALYLSFAPPPVQATQPWSAHDDSEQYRIGGR